MAVYNIEGLDVKSNDSRFTFKKGFSLLNNNELIVSKQECTEFFVYVIDFLVSNNLEISECNFIQTPTSGHGDRTPFYKQLPNHTEFQINTHSSNFEKISTIEKGFKWIKDNKNVDISLYKISVGDDVIDDNTNVENDNSRSDEKVFDLIDKAFNKSNKQIILTGAPGTGKTFGAKEYVKRITNDYNRYKFVQFHPSYDYSDFVEGLRPAFVKDKSEPTFVKFDGVFKELCRRIVVNNIEIAKLVFKDKSFDIEKLYKKYSSYILAKEKEGNALTDDDRQLIERISDYENQINDKKYFIIIDEINRADLSKVFGELMYGLEKSYRGVMNRFDTQYNYLPTYEIKKENNPDKIATSVGNDVFLKGFFIPENLYIIGTMNDIDKSVEAFDFALRRRFEWVEVKANDVMYDGLIGMYSNKGIPNLETKVNKLTNNIKVMNNYISTNDYKYGLTEAYHIGHAYFKGLEFNDLKTELEELFDTNIKSILKEYTRGRDSKKADDFIDKCRKKLIDGIDNNSNDNSQENP